MDFGKTATDYKTHRKGFPKEFFDKLESLGFDFNNQKLLDLGTGTGTLARGFALRGANVTALDKSESMLEEARYLDKQANESKQNPYIINIKYLKANSEEIPLTDQEFDLITAGQCWHWFVRDRAVKEVFRLLKPGGKFIIAHFDWIPLPGNVVEATEALITKYNPAWAMAGKAGLYPEWFKDVSAAGFTNIESFSFDQLVPYTHEAWCGRIRASAGVGASLDSHIVEKFDCEHKEMLKNKFPDNPLRILHRVWALICEKI